ncbi:arylsulfatase [Enemella sp. A6]|uniref:arylsulfatase n=1 Tax=Enemella sp. A6 TaxID=3440152 RepID=UPI003EB919D5
MSLDRKHLPIHTDFPQYTAVEDYREQEAALPQRPAVTAPEGAPNVLVILLDDMGFGAPSTFGGPCRMPVADRLAEDGLRFTRFHTTALCSPTRASLMTGRNHHAIGMGSVVELSTGAPGYDGIRPRSAATVAQILRHNGYATGCFGKWHQTPPWEQTAAGPFDRWPTGEGFDQFYGFLGGEASHYEPTLVRNTNFIDPPKEAADGYHLSEDLVDQTIDWLTSLRQQSDKPWFTYLSFGATHAPLHVPESWRDKYRGEFSHGWDAERDRILARQKALGVVADDTALAPWQEDIPRWDDLSEQQRTVAERLMELYAAFAEHTDAQVGRLIEHLTETGQLDNTLILYILGDNGPSAEGGFNGTLNETMRFNHVEDTAERIHDQLDDLGGPKTYPHYPTGWAQALATPYQHTKQVASHYGGTRNGMVVHWPAGTAEVGRACHQWHHVNDVLPTICDAVGIPVPESVDGVTQDPLDGVSFREAFDNAEAPETHHTQYFEMFGNRGIYHKGWTAVTYHRSPYLIKRPSTPLADDTWELYDTTTDWSQAENLADEHPEILEELRALFETEARRNRVFPIDDGTTRNRMNADLAGRVRVPITRMRLGPRDGFLREDAVPNLKNTSFRITAALDSLADGVLIAQGGGFSGWSFYLLDGRPVFAYNYVGRDLTHIRADEPLTELPRKLIADFAYDGGGLGQGGLLRIHADDKLIGEGRVDKTVPYFFSLDQTLNVGVDRGTPVTTDYPRPRFPYAGTIRHITIERGDDAATLADVGLAHGYLKTQ